jgi:hypothetical protein
MYSGGSACLTDFAELLPLTDGRRMGRGQTLGTWIPGADASGLGIEHLLYGVVRQQGGPPRPAGL